MKKYLVLLFLFVYMGSPCMGNKQLDSLLNVLDEDIKNTEFYINIKEKRIKELKHELLTLSTPSISRFDLNKKLYDEYRTYSSDSALYYLNENLLLTKQLKDKEREVETLLEQSDLLSTVGMYMEAKDILNSIERSSLSTSLLDLYYIYHERLYNEAGLAYPRYKILSSPYLKLRDLYRDSVLLTSPPLSEPFLRLRETQAKEKGNYSEAMDINNIRMSQTSFGTPQFALVAYHRARLFQNMGKEDDFVNNIILSAISDVRSAIKEQSSLMTLAQILYDKGDLERAYIYINYSWEISQSYRGRTRSWMNIGPLSMISGSYQSIINSQNTKLQTYLISIALLALLLSVALIYIYRQMKILALTKKGLQEVNKRLLSLNDELKIVNENLRFTNLELLESNKIKETYVAHFFKLSSTYVNRLSTYRNQINKQLKKNKIEEVLKMTSPTNDILTTEVQDLYANFDTAFLDLFPNFVKSLNELLLPEEQIDWKEGDLLSPELRILALIRLGITKSSQIAELLHYSPTTIYNYRARLMKKARVDREAFESLVAQIH